MRKAFLLLFIFLYAIFLLESITGYWIEKPREISTLFFNSFDYKGYWEKQGWSDKAIRGKDFFDIK